MLRQLRIVVDIGDVDGLAALRNVASDRLGVDRQLEVAEGGQPSLDLGDDVVLLMVHRVQREAVAVEQVAKFHTQVEHDLVQVVGGVDLGGDGLQLLEECQPQIRFAEIGTDACIIHV